MSIIIIIIAIITPPILEFKVGGDVELLLLKSTKYTDVKAQAVAKKKKK
jgi:hypothetical protein